MLGRVFLVLALLCGVAHAAPDQFSMEFEVVRNGLKLGNVSDSFTRNGDRYRLASVTQATGALALIWSATVRFESSGKIVAGGLVPLQFKHARSDAPNKLATATFDWDKHEVRHVYKGRTKQHELKAGAQDQLSVLYQFAFMPRPPAELALQVASGKSIKDYRYQRSDGGKVETPAGTFATQLYQHTGQTADDKSVSVWIAPALHNLPVKVRISEGGETVEQHLVRSSIGK